MSEMVPAQSLDARVAQAGVIAYDTALQRIARLFIDVVREHSWFIASSVGYVALGMAIGRIYGEKIRLSLYSTLSWHLCFWFVFTYLVLRVILMLIKHRPEHPLQFVWADLYAAHFSPRRVLSAIPPFFLLPAVFSVVMSIKRMIPLIHPFNWDPTLATIDTWLHAGFHPWELLQPVLGHPFVTVAIAHAYSVPWFLLVLLTQFWCIFSADPRRQQFLLTLVLTWVLLGNGMAAAFASVGPCFYDQFVQGPNPFEAQMVYLAGVADTHQLLSAMAQEYLWSAYQSDFLRLGSGISAMPSMHLAIGTLMVLWVWHRGRILRTIGLAYLVVLQIGSVHLAWHYAIDGYVAIAGTLTIWRIVGWLLDRRARKDLASSYC